MINQKKRMIVFMIRGYHSKTTSIIIQVIIGNHLNQLVREFEIIFVLLLLIRFFSLSLSLSLCRRKRSFLPRVQQWRAPWRVLSSRRASTCQRTHRPLTASCTRVLAANTRSSLSPFPLFDPGNSRTKWRNLSRSLWLLTRIFLFPKIRAAIFFFPSNEIQDLPLKLADFSRDSREGISIISNRDFFCTITRLDRERKIRKSCMTRGANNQRIHN